MPKGIQKTETSEKNIEKVLNAYDKQQHHHKDDLAIQYLPAVRRDGVSFKRAFAQLY